MASQDPIGGDKSDGQRSPRSPEELRVAARSLASRLDWPPARSGYLSVRWVSRILQDEREYQGDPYPPQGLWEWRHKDLVLTPDGVAILVAEGVGLIKDVGSGAVIEHAADDDLLNAGGSHDVNDYTWDDGCSRVRSRRAEGEPRKAISDTWLLIQGVQAEPPTGQYLTKRHEPTRKAGGESKTGGTPRPLWSWALAILLIFGLIFLGIRLLGP